MSVKYIAFIILMFVIAAASDVLLHYFSFRDDASKTLRVLRPYYKAYGPILSPVLAGITVTVVFLVHTILFQMIFSKVLPTNDYQTGWFILLAILLGILADFVIDRMHIFGNNLEEWYKLKVAYMWGFISYLLALGCSSAAYKMLCIFGFIPA